MAILPTPPIDSSMAAGMSGGDNLDFGHPNHSSLADEIFGNQYRRKDHVDSFAERQVKLAKQSAEEQLWAGRKLLEGVQGKHSALFSTAG